MEKINGQLTAINGDLHRGRGARAPGGCAVVVVDADKRTRKREYLAEGDEHAAVYHPRRRQGYTRREQCAPESAQQWC